MKIPAASQGWRHCASALAATPHPRSCAPAISGTTSQNHQSSNQSLHGFESRGPIESAQRILIALQVAGAHVRSAFDDDITRNFAAWTEGLLRFAIKFGLDATGITEGQNKLVLAFPSGPLSRP